MDRRKRKRLPSFAWGSLLEHIQVRIVDGLTLRSTAASARVMTSCGTPAAGTLHESSASSWILEARMVTERNGWSAKISSSRLRRVSSIPCSAFMLRLLYADLFHGIRDSRRAESLGNWLT